MFRCVCPRCGKRFTGSSRRSALAGRSRHVRTMHGTAADRRKARDRATMQKRALRQARASVGVSQRGRLLPREPIAVPVGSAAAGGPVLYSVVCPLRRERSDHMFTQTRSLLAQGGVHPSCVVRIEGIDAAAHPLLPKVRLLHYFWDARWRHWAQRMFETRPELRVIVWVEDDCKPAPAFPGAGLLRFVETVSPAVAWLGWCARDGQPRYGSQLVGFTPASLQAAAAAMAASRDPGARRAHSRGRRGTHKHKGGYNPLTADDSAGYEGFDTWLWKLSRLRPARARAHRPTLASQRSHALAGRR